ncbi:uncharacterized protein LOC122256366 isoform X2 [Penaeus japonicus]|uniref:uncharacterized protein LOC122256366 isoform X2 n=1 Tax=Penaeus japonicus TaxID=27405 RepID=UPI001C70CA55|nr:uncharacterized protein LOC122256366 isoform X2 [Penaeus japonicus]
MMTRREIFVLIVASICFVAVAATDSSSPSSTGASTSPKTDAGLPSTSHSTSPTPEVTPREKTDETPSTTAEPITSDTLPGTNTSSTTEDPITTSTLPGTTTSSTTPNIATPNTTPKSTTPSTTAEPITTDTLPDTTTISTTPNITTSSTTPEPTTTSPEATTSSTTPNIATPNTTPKSTTPSTAAEPITTDTLPDTTTISTTPNITTSSTTPEPSTTDTSPDTTTSSTTPKPTTTSPETTTPSTTPNITTSNTTPDITTPSTTPDITTSNTTPEPTTTDTSPETTTPSTTPNISTSTTETTDTSPIDSSTAYTSSVYSTTSTPTPTSVRSTSTLSSVQPTVTSNPPVTCSVDPNATTIEAYITLPRTLVVDWGKSAPLSVEVCLIWEGHTDCRDTEEAPVEFEWAMAGTPLLVTVQGGSFYDCVILFVPWQFRIGAAAKNLTLDWINDEPSELNICVVRDNGYFPFDNSWTNCHETLGSATYIYSLDPDTAYWVKVGESTVFHTSTAPLDKYRSIAFRCHEDGVCGGLECRPATDGVLFYLDGASPVPESYPYVCVDKNNANPGPIVDLTAAPKRLAITSVVFESGGLGGDVEECVHATALAVVKYWCDGKEQCSVDFSFLHSYLAGAEGCVDTRLGEYALHIEYEAANPNLTCNLGELYSPHSTCYEVIVSSLQSAREGCMEAGGDLAFYEHDQDFVTFLNDTFGLSEEGLIVQGIIGDDARPREPQLYAEQTDGLRILFDAAHVVVNPASTSDLPVLCAFPPVVDGIVTERLETATMGGEPCLVNPCENGGSCFNASLGLAAVTGSGENFMCLCLENYSGNLCENANSGIKDELMQPVDGVYSFSAPFDEALSFEFAYFGQLSAGKLNGCYALAALSLFRLKCNGQSVCQVSYKDLHHHLHSSCHPAVSPELHVRYTSYDGLDTWSCGGESVPLDSTCLGTSTEQFGNDQDAKLYCNGMGGDLASAIDPDISLCINNASSLWVDNFTEFHAHPNFRLTANNPIPLSCTEQQYSSHSVLCVFPLLYSNSTNTTTEATTTSTSTTYSTTTTTETTSTSTSTTDSTTTTTEATTSTSTTEVTNITTTATSTTTEVPTPSTTTNTSTTSTTTSTVSPPQPCPRKRPFPSAYPQYYWNETQPDFVAQNACPKPKENVKVFWLCGSFGKWVGLPDLR